MNDFNKEIKKDFDDVIIDNIDIEKIRTNIDDIDIKLLNLLNERAYYAKEIGKIKKINNYPIFEAKREEIIANNIIANNKGPLSNEALIRIYVNIIREMRDIQKEKN